MPAFEFAGWHPKSWPLWGQTACEGEMNVTEVLVMESSWCLVGVFGI